MNDAYVWVGGRREGGMPANLHPSLSFATLETLFPVALPALYPKRRGLCGGNKQWSHSDLMGKIKSHGLLWWLYWSIWEKEKQRCWVIRLFTTSASSRAVFGGILLNVSYNLRKSSHDQNKMRINNQVAVLPPPQLTKWRFLEESKQKEMAQPILQANSAPSDRSLTITKLARVNDCYLDKIIAGI